MSKRSNLDRLASDLILAFGLLTRLPLPARAVDPARTATAAWAWPIVGAVVGCLAAAAGWAAVRAGTPPMLAAAVALGVLALVTGGLHEDGLADTADGLWGGVSRSQRLEIMRDSRIGAYGVLALGIVFAIRWSAVTALAASGSWGALIAAAAASRAGMAALMAALPPARADGLSRGTGRPPSSSVAVAGLAGLAAIVALAPGAGWAIAGGLLVLLTVGRVARQKLGGQTGDILGCAQQVSEAAILAVAASALGR
ncbi:MAG: adenosylcobinamide-GDP ribazoletransferase [Pseudomonadota bacterium]